MRYRKGPHAPATAEVVWGGKQGWRIKLYSSFGYGPRTPAVIFHDDPFWTVLVQAGVVEPYMETVTRVA